jgi:hypothetical protein
MGWPDAAQPDVERWRNVRITVDLDEDLLLAVEERRTACKTTGQVLADLARQALRTSPAPELTTISPVPGGVLRRGADLSDQVNR